MKQTVMFKESMCDGIPLKLELIRDVGNDESPKMTKAHNHLSALEPFDDGAIIVAMPVADVLPDNMQNFLDLMAKEIYKHYIKASAADLVPKKPESLKDFAIVIAAFKRSAKKE